MTELFHLVSSGNSVRGGIFKESLSIIDYDPIEHYG